MLYIDGSERYITNGFYWLGILLYFLLPSHPLLFLLLFLVLLLSSLSLCLPSRLQATRKQGKSIFKWHTFICLVMFHGWLIHSTRELHFKKLRVVAFFFFFIDSFGYSNIFLVFKIVSYSLTSLLNGDD